MDRPARVVDDAHLATVGLDQARLLQPAEGGADRLGLLRVAKACEPLNLMWIENVRDVPNAPRQPSHLEGVDEDGDEAPSSEEVILGFTVGFILP